MMQRTVIGVVVAALLGGAFATAVASTPNAASEPGIQTPEKGDPERKAILDALRVAYAQKVVFRVHYLKVSGDWAWARVTPTVDGKSAYEDESALVRRLRGKWTRVVALNHSGECDDNPVCRDEGQTGVCGFDSVCSDRGREQLYAKLKTIFPGVPLDIIEGYKQPLIGNPTTSAQSTSIGASSVRAVFPAVFNAIEDFDFPNTLNKTAAKATATEAVETTLLFLKKIQSNTHAEALGISAENFAKMFTANPAAALDLIKADILVSTGKSMFIDFVAKLITNFAFDRPPMDTWPREVRVPLEALFEAVFVEGLGLMDDGAAPTPVSLVGPVLSRVYDVYEIYQATNALARTQQTGLLAVALGAETNAELAVRHPSARTDTLISQWMRETKANLARIVGRDDVREVSAIVDLGYSALLSATQGNNEEARKKIDRMLDIGKQGDGPLLLSAEGPLDLLVKIAAGGDAPRQAAQTFVSATRLSEIGKAGDAQNRLGRSGTAIVAMPVGGEKTCSPTMAGTCSICDPIKLGLFESPSSNAELGLKWSGTCDRKVSLFGGNAIDDVINGVTNWLKNRNIKVLSTAHKVEFPNLGGSIYFEIPSADVRDQTKYKAINDLQKAFSFRYMAFPQSLPNQQTAGNAHSKFLQFPFEYERIGSVNGFGTLTAYEGEKDYFEVGASQSNGLEFKDGRPVFTIAEDRIVVRTATRAGVQRIGECPDNAYLIRTYVIVDGDPPLHLDAVADKIIESAHKKLVSTCPSVGKSSYRGLLVTSNVARGFGKFEDMVARTDKGELPLSSVTCEGRFSEDKLCSDRRFNSIKREHMQTMNARYQQRVTAEANKRQMAEQRRQQEAREAEKNRIAELRKAAEEKWKSKWEAALNGQDPWENITDLMRFNKAATIAKLSEGHLVLLEYKSKEVEFADGRSVLKDHQPGTDIYSGIPEGGFSWANWFDALHGATKRSFDVLCMLEPRSLIGLNEGQRYVFKGTLKTVIDSDYVAKVVLECERAQH